MHGETGQLTLKESLLKKSYPTTLKRNSNKVTQCKYLPIIISYYLLLIYYYVLKISLNTECT